MSGRYSEQFYLSPSLGNDGLTINPAVRFDGTQTISTATVTTVPVSVKDVDAYSVQISTPAGSTLAGSFAIQVSNDRGAYEQTAGGGDVQMTDWTTLAFTDVAATTNPVTTKAITSGANAVMLAERGCTYRYMRVVFSGGTGTGTPRISFQQKGWA